MIKPNENETEVQKNERIQKEYRNSFVRIYIYPYEPNPELPKIDDSEESDEMEQINEHQRQIDMVEFFNNRIYSLVTKQIVDNLEYPERSEIDSLLINLGIPTSLQNLSQFEVYQLRKKYPYAWYTKDVPSYFSQHNKTIIKNISNNSPKNKELLSINIGLLNSLTRQKWKKTNKDAEQLYELYMKLLDLSLPFPSEITLFRGINLSTIPKIGDIITEYGFSSKSYFDFISKKYSTSDCCLLMIRYPAYHKFLMPLYGSKVKFSEFMSYPGERIQVDHILEEDGKFILLCHFVGYEPHVNPRHETVTIQSIVNPVLTSIRIISKS